MNKMNNGEAVDFSEKVSLISEMESIPDNPWSIIDSWVPVKENSTERSCVGTLATADSKNTVSSRSMNIRFLKKQIFLATHRGSKKWRGDLNKQSASWHVYWPKKRRQIDIRGQLIEAAPSLAEKWWNERPAKMDLVSTLSFQSQVASYADIKEIKRQTRIAINDSALGEKLPKPKAFIVLQLIPSEIEFWEGSFDRVHNRYIFENDKGTEWKRSLLFP